MLAPNNRELLTSPAARDSDGFSARVLSVALIGPEKNCRNAVAKALAGSQVGVTHEFASYPTVVDASRLLESNYDIIIIELDSNPECALDLVEHMVGNSSVIVMVYSARIDSEMLVRCMRAGAREFLALPIGPGAIAEALIRASVRLPATPAAKKGSGKLLAFLGAKGGSGVTTIASNFAVALAQESGQKTVLIDLALPLGDAALSLGIVAQLSTAHALHNFNRLDSNFISKLLTKHRSGLFVLSAPDEYTTTQPTAEEVERLMTITRQDFDYVVVDAGSSVPAFRSLLEASATVYLVTQVGISELRNSNRFISKFFAADSQKLEVVLNRFTHHLLEIDEHHIKKALTVPIQWKVPSDRNAVVRAQNTAQAIALKDSPISRAIRRMARTACGLPQFPQKNGFSLFG